MGATQRGVGTPEAVCDGPPRPGGIVQLTVGSREMTPSLDDATNGSFIEATIFATIFAVIGTQLPFGDHISPSGFFQGRLGSRSGDRHKNRAEKNGGGRENQSALRGS